MKVTVIPVDKYVSIDGNGRANLDLSRLPSDIHAIQWFGSSGWVEYTDARENRSLDSFDEFDWVIDAWQHQVVAEEPSDVDIYYNTIDTIEQQYPSANPQSVDILVTADYKNLYAIPRVRNDGLLVGVWIVRMADAFAARRFTDDAIALGVPIFGNASDETASFWEALGYINYKVGTQIYTYYPWSLDLAKNRKTRLVERARDNAISSGVVWNNYTWDCDTQSRANLTSVVATISAGVLLPNNFVWRTKDNQNILMSSDDVVALSSAMLTHVNEAYQESWQRKAVVASASTEAEVDAA